MYRLYDPKYHGYAIAEFNPEASSIHQHITIKPGFQLTANELNDSFTFIAGKRKEHLAFGDIVKRGDHYLVLNDISFSISGSAAMIMGRNPGSGAVQWGISKLPKH